MSISDFEFSLKVLLIGEVRETEELLGDTLNAIGYDTSIVETIDDAKRALKESRYDLIIGDPRRTEGSWAELLKSAKKEKIKIPVIFITDRGDEDKNKYIKAGADGILTKPFRIGMVEELIASTLFSYDKPSGSLEKRLKNILVADDDESMLSIINGALTTLGYNTILARSGKEALEYFKKGEFDLLITDYMMPEMTGKELISSIKKMKSDIPAVMITGYPLAFPPGAARSEGIDAYLVKPFRINQLKDVVSRLLPDKN